MFYIACCYNYWVICLCNFTVNIRSKNTIVIICHNFFVISHISGWGITISIYQSVWYPMEVQIMYIWGTDIRLLKPGSHCENVGNFWLCQTVDCSHSWIYNKTIFLYVYVLKPGRGYLIMKFTVFNTSEFKLDFLNMFFWLPTEFLTMSASCMCVCVCVCVCFIITEIMEFCLYQ